MNHLYGHFHHRPGTNPPGGGAYGAFAPPPPPNVYDPNAPAIPSGTATGVNSNVYHGVYPPEPLFYSDTYAAL